MENKIVRSDITITTGHDNIISVQVTNKKIKRQNIEDLEEAIASLHDSYQHINIIILLSGRLGISLSSNVEALRMFFRTKNIVKKIAVVSDKKWVEFGAKVENLVTPWDEKYFSSTDLEAAWKWVQS